MWVIGKKVNLKHGVIIITVYVVNSQCLVQVIMLL